MTRIVLLRHAHSVANEKNILAGRINGISLSSEGKEQSRLLVDRIGATKFDQISISPLQRCRETISPWMKAYGGKTPITIEERISEVDYGSWSGKSLAVLRKRSQWRTVVLHPSQMIFPEGESLLEMQSRALSAFYSLNAVKGRNPRLLVSHGDVIKSIVAHCLGMHLDQFQKLIIDPASLTIIDTEDGVSRLVRFNDVSGHLAATSPSSTNALGGSTGNSK
ncbi:MAG: histidine phosphatase family protein [Candidatus Planktophila sp.]